MIWFEQFLPYWNGPFDLPLLLLVFLIAGAFAVSYRTLFCLWWAWDDGNNLYPAVAWLKGLRPNIHFRSGYPGMQAALYAFFIRLFGIKLHPIKLFVLLCALITASSGFFLVRDILPYGGLLGLVTFILIFFSSYLVFPSPNAGFIMEALAAAGMVLLYAAISILAAGAPLTLPLILMLHGAALCFGLSFTFKQAGLFYLLGFAVVLVLLCDHSTPLLAMLRWLAFAGLAVLPAIGFFVLRLRHIPRAALPRAAVFLIWPAILCLALRSMMVMPQGFSLPVEFCVSLGLTALAAALAWLPLYGFNPRHWKKVLAECFVTVPKLIDRHMPEALPPRQTCLALALSFAVLVIAVGSAQLFPLLADNKVFGAVSNSIWWTALLLGLALFPSLMHEIRHMLRDTYWVPALLGAQGLFAFALFAPAALSLPVMIVLVMGSYSLLSLFPYDKNPMFAALGTATGYLVYICAIFYFSASLPVPLAALLQGVALAFLWGAAVAALYYVKESQQIMTGVAERPRGLETIPHEIPFFWALNWIKDNLPANATVMSYPNLAICFALCGRLTEGFLPNFLGTRADYDALLQQLEGVNAPDYFVTSPMLYPYRRGVNPYLFDPEDLMAVLERRYERVGECISDTNRVVIGIYRRKPQVVSPQTFSFTMA